MDLREDRFPLMVRKCMVESGGAASRSGCLPLLQLSPYDQSVMMYDRGHGLAHLVPSWSQSELTCGLRKLIQKEFLKTMASCPLSFSAALPVLSQTGKAHRAPFCALGDIPQQGHPHWDRGFLETTIMPCSSGVAPRVRRTAAPWLCAGRNFIF